MTTRIIPIPQEADGVVIQTAPDIAVTALLAPGPQTVTVSDNGGIRFQYDRPRLAIQQRIGMDGNPDSYKLFHVRGADPLTGMMGGPYMVGNVHHTGEICWGGVNTPPHLRAFVGAFFGSPFNRDLTSSARPNRNQDDQEINRQVAREWAAEEARLRANPAELGVPQAAPIPPNPAWFANPADAALADANRNASLDARRAYGDALTAAAQAAGEDEWHLERRVFGYGYATPLEPNHPLVPLWQRMCDAERVHNQTDALVRRRECVLDILTREIESYARWLAYQPQRAGVRGIDRLTPSRRGRLRRVAREQGEHLTNPDFLGALVEWVEASLDVACARITFTNLLRERADIFVQQRTEAIQRERRPDAETLRSAFRAWFAGGYAAGARDISVGAVIGGTRYAKIDSNVPAAFLSTEAPVRAMFPGATSRWVVGFAAPHPTLPKTWNVAVPTPTGPVRFVYDMDADTVTAA